MDIDSEIDRVNVRESLERQVGMSLHSRLISLQEDISKAYQEYVSYMDAKEYTMAAAAVGKMTQAAKSLHKLEDLLLSNIFSLNVVKNTHDWISVVEAAAKKSKGKK